MRLEALRLERFGHFADAEVRFGPGLTVVHGPNEAGKSTLLDGLGWFLWGIPARNRRAFTYAPGQAALTGTVASGSVAVTMRRRLAALTCGGDSVTPPWGAAAKNSCDEWRLGFGMDRDGLRAGGRQVVAGEGDLADLIALAETGQAIQGVLATLTQRADALFKDRKGSDCLIRTEMKQIAALAEELERTQASASDVADLQQELAGLRDQKQGLDLQLLAARRQLRGLEELLRCLEPAAQLRDAEDGVRRIRDLGPVLDVASTTELAAAVERQERARKAVQEREGQLNLARQRLARHRADPQVLAVADEIARLREQLEARRTDADLMRSDAASGLLLAAVADILGRLGHPHTTDPMVTAAEVLLGDQVRDLLRRHAADVTSLQSSVDTMTAMIDDLAGELAQAHVPEGDGAREVSEARSRRDDRWERIKSPWLSGEIPDPALRRRLAADLDEATEAADLVASLHGAALERLGHVKGQVDDRSRRLQKAQDQLRVEQAKLNQALSQWGELAGHHGLPAGLDPLAWAVHDRLLDELAAAVREVRADQERRAAAAQRFTEFERTSAPLAALVPEGPTDPIARVEALAGVLDESRAAALAIEELDRQITDLSDQIIGHEAEQTAAAADVARILGTLEAHQEPAAVLLDRSVRLHDAERSMRDALAGLRLAMNPDSEVEALRSAAAEADVVALEAASTETTARVTDLTVALDDVQSRIGAAQHELSALESRAPVADLMARRLEHGAHLRALVEEYRSLRVQIELLTEYKKWLADRTDSVLLEQAGRILADLTNGKYTGFAVNQDPGRPRIEVVAADPSAPDDRIVLGLGDLSEGTADQVFLALRLAGIALRQRQRVASGLSIVPVVLDDVLMSHDDERTAAALRAMAVLGEHMQIILLTHHESVAEAARRIEGVVVTGLATASERVGTRA